LSDNIFDASATARSSSVPTKTLPREACCHDCDKRSRSRGAFLGYFLAVVVRDDEARGVHSAASRLLRLTGDDDQMMKTPKKLWSGLPVFMAVIAASATGCGGGQTQTEEPSPNTSKEVEEAGESVGEEVEGAAEDVGEAAEEGADEAEDAVD